MEQKIECKNPSNLLCGLLDTFSCAAYILDDDKNLIMNDKARELFLKGFDIKNYLSASYIQFRDQRYSLKQKDINHGTKSKLFILEAVDDTIVKLSESSKKLRQVLSAL
jgi:hypothetical protein